MESYTRCSWHIVQSFAGDKRLLGVVSKDFKYRVSLKNRLAPYFRLLVLIPFVGRSVPFCVGEAHILVQASVVVRKLESRSHQLFLREKTNKKLVG